MGKERNVFDAAIELADELGSLKVKYAMLGEERDALLAYLERGLLYCRKGIPQKPHGGPCTPELGCSQQCVEASEFHFWLNEGQALVDECRKGECNVGGNVL